MLILAILVLVTGAFYAVTILRFASGFRRVMRLRTVSQSARPSITVIVPARNEESHIAKCVRSILRNTYPHDRLEVIVVDDGSTDRTVQAVRPLCAHHPVHIIQAGARGQGVGKKAALEAGIQASSGEIIVTTDADCRVGRHWLEAMTQRFDDRTGYVAGPVVFSPARGMAARVQALEFLGLIAVGAGAIGRDQPILSNGANAAFRREAFEEVGGFPGKTDAGPGDDDMLMQRIAYETSWEVRFCGDPEAVVRTMPPRDLPEFVSQRLRWASTAPRYRHGTIRPMLVGVYAFYVLLLATAVAIPFVPGAAGLLLVALALKIAPEATLLTAAVRRFGSPGWLRWFLPAQLLHVPYVVFFPAAGSLMGYRWKGRRLRS